MFQKRVRMTVLGQNNLLAADVAQRYMSSDICVPLCPDSAIRSVYRKTSGGWFIRGSHGGGFSVVRPLTMGTVACCIRRSISMCLPGRRHAMYMHISRGDLLGFDFDSMRALPYSTTDTQQS